LITYHCHSRIAFDTSAHDYEEILLMPVSGLLSAGLELMLMGMGVVFLLLTLLVYTLTYVSRFIQRTQVEPPTPELATPAPAPLESRPAPVTAPPPPPATETYRDPNLAAVIGAAIYRYRAAHSQSN
jgi:oxaloacetate decarboxylase gamma subunit